MAGESQPLYKDTTQPFEVRVDDLVGRMTLLEKIQQMIYGAPGINHLDVPAYNWWNECLHGVGRAGIATVFPQAIGMAASWNLDLIDEVATVISDEGRAKYHEALRNGEVGVQYYGLTFWTPNINIFRDPRWGRGQETYGEDPFLTARIGVTFINALQDNGGKYLKSAACAKHYAVHSGPESERHRFNAVVSDKDLWETYLPAFEAAAIEANVESFMGAYNRTNDEPCCGSPTLLQKILREKWGFKGHITSDCWAIIDFYEHHKIVDTREEAAAMAVNAGCDLNCGSTYDALVGAVEQGLISEETITKSVKRLFLTRFKLGMFDPPEDVPYTQIPFSVNDSEEHKALALRTAQESMVLLRNEGDFLPLAKDAGTLAVIGPNADDSDVLLGNYNGKPSSLVTPLAGIKAKVGDAAEVLYAQGCLVAGDDASGYDAALAVAAKADTILFFGGLSQWLEGEEGQHDSVPEGEKSQGDRTYIELPPIQANLLDKIIALGKPVVLVLLNGSAVAVNPPADKVPAVVEAWYPGQAGGTAIADVLFGDYNPGGRLPVTFYKSTDDLPPFEDYSMANRTYRFFEGEALYPFGHGLSYTRFQYSDLRVLSQKASVGDWVSISVNVTNVGERAGDEVVQLYVTDVDASTRVPLRNLRGFDRIYLEPGATQTVSFALKPEDLALVNDAGEKVVEPGQFSFTVGGRQPIPDASGDDIVAGDFELVGEPLKL